MRRQATSLRSVTTVLLVGGLAGGLSACGGGSGGGSSPPPLPVVSGEALEAAITANPASTAPDLLSADGSGTPTDTAMLEEMADAARTEIGGWDDNVYARTIGSDSTDTFVLYNNKEAPKDTPFSDVYTLDYDADNDSMNDSLTVDMNNVETITSVPSFPNVGTRTEVQYPDGEVLSGSFAEASGTYTCVSGCSLSGESNGSFDAIGGSWFFTPDNESDPVPVPDSDFIHFGYWLNETEVSGAFTYMVAPIAGGTVEAAIATVQSLEGRASYSGPATGMYVTRTYTLDGEVDSRTGGQFTAEAILTATFGGSGVPANAHYTIMGSIKDFTDRRGRAIDSSWSVDLERALFGSQHSGALTGANGNVFSGTTEGDQEAMRGTWNGRFFGTAAVPSSVAGTFSAHFTNGDVLGAFGAEVDE